MKTRIVQQQKVHSKQSKLTYWDYVEKSPLQQENALSNPDLCAMPESALPSEEQTAILAILDEGGEQILTKREHRAFQLVVRQGLTEREAAKRMGCTFQSVQVFVRRAGVKLRKLCLSKMS